MRGRDEAIDTIAKTTLFAMAFMSIVKLVDWDIYPVWVFLIPIALASLSERIVRFWYRRK